GVSGWYSLITGWRPSYIETTGYIINTFFDVAEHYSIPEYKDRAAQMANFLLDMQLPSGAYRVYTPQQNISEKVVVFDMGQDLLGMVHAYEVTKEKKYFVSAVAAAQYLLSIQESDGTWIKNTYGNTFHTYHTRVAWGILRVFEVTQSKQFKVAALKNLRWAQKQQLKNGWFLNNQLPLPNPQVPYTHTISYAIEGFLWSGLLLNDPSLIQTALRGAVPLLNHYLEHDFLPATFDKNWNSDDRYSCLTGNAQISHMWLELYKITQDKRFLFGAKRMNAYLKSIQNISSKFKAIQGAIAGSNPIYGDLFRNRGYCRMAYLNWATKFFIDALLEEEKIRQRETIHTITKTA
ncbi:MAG: hypothetical protein WAU07_04325, partial [Microgenomates group bacterium]